MSIDQLAQVFNLSQCIFAIRKHRWKSQYIAIFGQESRLDRDRVANSTHGKYAAPGNGVVFHVFWRHGGLRRGPLHLFYGLRFSL